MPTSISWDLNSDNLVIGTLNGMVETWDVEKAKIIRKIKDHTERVGAISMI